MYFNKRNKFIRFWQTEKYFSNFILILGTHKTLPRKGFQPIVIK